MQGLAEIVRPLIDEGLSERTLSAARAECFSKACQGRDLCGWLLLTSIFQIAEAAVSDRPVTAAEVEGMTVVLAPLLRQLGSVSPVSGEDLCEMVNLQPDLVRRLTSCHKR